MMTDTNIVQAHGHFTVLAERLRVVFREGDEVTLHRVRSHGFDSPLLRAVEAEPGNWFVFDLRCTGRTLARDLAAMPERDANGLVLYTLRELFPSATELLIRVVANSLEVWRAAGEQLALDIPIEPASPALVFQPMLRAAA